jgi:AcrR family transcriptional regulator
MWQVLSHEATERSATVTAVGLRERKRERTRDDIVDAALHLFVDHGFEATTVESIAAAADVSQRTFFRYFPVKEDVLFDEAGSARQRDRIVAELEAHQGGVAPVRMVVDALRTLQPTWESELPTLMMRHQVIGDTPALASRARRRRHLWESAVVDTLARRCGSSADALLELQVTVAATTAGTQVALDTWVSSGGRRKLGALLDQVWQLLIDGLDRPR